MTARYMDSVPILQKQWTIRGYIWQIGPLKAVPSAANIIDDCAYVGQMPDASVLVATQTQRPPDPKDLEKLGISCAAIPRSWVVQMYNEEDEKSPLAVLDDTGRYFQLESFGIFLEEKNLDNATDKICDRLPVICEFRMGQTSGHIRICPE